MTRRRRIERGRWKGKVVHFPSSVIRFPGKALLISLATLLKTGVSSNTGGLPFVFYVIERIIALESRDCKTKGVSR